MKHSAREGIPIGMYSGSCGKREMLERNLRDMQKRNIKITIIDPQKELESFVSRIEPDKKGT